MSVQQTVDIETPSHPAVQRVEWLSHLLDEAVRIPGTEYRVGLDPIVGILPGVGDSLSSVVSLYIVFEAYRAEVPASTLLRMLAYVAIDTVIGSVPILGTIFDAAWKANSWNARLLVEHIEES